MRSSANEHRRQPGIVALLTASTLFVAGCAGGPAPLAALVRLDDASAYDAQLASNNGDARAAYLSWRSQETGTPVADLITADENLSTHTNPFDPGDLWAARRGALLYEVHCLDCHGRAADGIGAFGEPLPGRKDFHNPHIRAGIAMSDSYVAGWFRTVHDGTEAVHDAENPTPGMPAFGAQLTNEQIWLAITYLTTKDSLVTESRQ